SVTLTLIFIPFNNVIKISFAVICGIFVLTYTFNEFRRHPSAFKTANMYKRLQLLSSAAFSVGHGGNDAQKVMGIISAALVAKGVIADIKNMPVWVPI